MVKPIKMMGDVADALAQLGGDVEAMRARALVDCIKIFAARGRAIRETREDARQVKPDEIGPEMEEADYAS